MSSFSVISFLQLSSQILELGVSGWANDSTSVLASVINTHSYMQQQCTLTALKHVFKAKKRLAFGMYRDFFKEQTTQSQTSILSAALLSCNLRRWKAAMI